MLEGLNQRVVDTYLPLLHRLVDSLALLDMLAGFAAAAADGPPGRPYVRPALTEVRCLRFLCPGCDVPLRRRMWGLPGQRC